MQLPNNSEIFKNIVIEKIKTYCDTNIWPFEYDNFAAWLNNFDCKIEEYVALQILDNLIVRSNDMAKTSYARLLNSSVLQHLLENTSLNINSIPKWKKCLSNGSLSNQLRIAPVRLISDEGESGSVIYRMLSNKVDTNRYSLASANFLPEIIILVDDFIGSGDQFLSYADQFDLSNKLNNSHILYCPLIGFEDGINTIRKTFPKLHILPAEVIYKTDSLFFGDNESLFKNDQVNTIADIKKFLSGMKDKYAPKKSNWLGYKDAALPLSFEWGCPNQTLSLLYLDHSKNITEWQKLFGRRS